MEFKSISFMTTPPRDRKTIKSRMEMGNVSKRQQPDHRNKKTAEGS